MITSNYLEEQAIYILREVAGQFQNPSLLFSGGKDSIALLHLSQKAFAPATIPYPLLHIDTGHNFPETIRHRDYLVKKYNVTLHVGYVQDSIDRGTVIEEKGKDASRNILQTTTLLETIERFKIDACIGGARRDEEKARAKERVFSVRDIFGQWNEKLQRPEVFDFLNGLIHHGENVRVFPISNWTELDVWEYIRDQKLELPSIYYAHQRKVFLKNGQWMPASKLSQISNDQIETKMVRFRTVGDLSCTAAVLSDAQDIGSVIHEIKQSSFSERGARMDDKRSEGAMEERKKVGYF
ncbi:MAG: sulfate adenylyltransferase subunit 2 [Flavobacteriaceae bacterium]|nr:sulfate adenylyltransferase subunit 2 [Flavobacteriaceae bacterium]MCY4268354.1 sulfate adenylyltransferase subunit 2 [Flavobacteriaceae bacterium]MCY4299203.1 sulfate adenylyltransferase subunit 2 [Flavobacteriaceae bacterium]